MSSRRSVGEDNILAMLERDSARRAGTRISRARLAWYGAAAALSGIFAGGVAWLAYDNGLGAVAPNVGDIVAAPAPVVAVARAARAAPGPALPALIVDDEPRMRTAPPPLVMLPPQEPRSAAAASAPVLAAPPERPLSAPAPAVRKAPPARPLARAPEKRVQPGRRDEGAAKSVARAARAKTASAARVRHAAPSTREADRDGDVALISAIIAQSERHQGEREAPPPARPTRP